MSDDERAVRAVVDTWLAATKAGDVASVLDLMTDDVVFMTPGQEPFGKAAFAAATESMKSARVQFDGRSEIKEVQLLGGWAFMRTRLDVSVTPPDGSAPVRRSGYTLTILRKESDGRWRLARDANLLA